MDVTLFEQLAEHDEADRLRVYDDATGKTIGPGTLVIGNPTIGVGRNVGPTGPGLRESEVKTMLDNDASLYDAQGQAFPWYQTLNPTRQTVTALMIFNMGLEHFDSFHQMLACIAAGNTDGAAAQMLDSHWAQPPPVGVGDRARRLAEIFRQGTPS
jgi:lysozyme